MVDDVNKRGVSEMTPQEFVKLRARLSIEIQKLRVQIAQAEAEARLSPVPAELRPASPFEIVPGAVVWLKWEDSFIWVIIKDVPNSDYQCEEFVAENQCFYRLEECFMEKGEN